MVSFEDDEDPAAASDDNSQDEDENMLDDGDEGDATMADFDEPQEPDDDDADADPDADDDADDDDEEQDSPSARPGPTVTLTSPSPRPGSSRTTQTSYISPVRPEALSATTYDIVPTMAAPQGTSINAVACTPDMRWVFSGGADGYVRMYNWVETANGRVPLTVAQKHPFVDSVMKAGSLTTYWENEEKDAGEGEAKDTSPVYALAAQHQALWLLSGTEAGVVNVQTCRHAAGTRIAALKGHTSAVSVLSLDQDEMGCLSGSWDKTIKEWDLNTGQVKRSYLGSGGQISALEIRPMSTLAVPKVETAEVRSETLSHNYDRPATTNGFNGKADDGGEEDAMGSPDGSLFGENDHGSLFGEGDDGEGGGGAAFGDDDVNFDTTIVDTAPEPTAEEAPPTTNGDATQDPPPTIDIAPAAEPDKDMADFDFTTTDTNGLSAPDPSPAPKSESVFLDAAIDGTLRIWDRRVPDPIARILPQRGTPPWCMGACWSPDGNTFYAGRRNGSVDEYSLLKGGGMAEPVRTLRFPQGSGAVSAVRAMPNGRGLVCASYDILRLYDLKAETSGKHSTVPFLIVPGHRTGVISALHVDPSCRFMISTAGNRGWEGNSTEVLLGYEIGFPAAG